MHIIMKCSTRVLRASNAKITFHTPRVLDILIHALMGYLRDGKYNVNVF